MGAQPKCRTQPRILDGDVRHQMGHGRGEDDKLLFFCTFKRVVVSLQHECVSFGNWYVGSSGSNIRTCEYIGNTRKRQRLSLSAVHSQRAKKDASHVFSCILQYLGRRTSNNSWGRAGDQCKHGGRFRKSAACLCRGFVSTVLTHPSRRCRSGRHQLCGHSRTPHLRMMGRPLDWRGQRLPPTTLVRCPESWPKCCWHARCAVSA